jgi:hypothetical protein
MAIPPFKSAPSHPKEALWLCTIISLHVPNHAVSHARRRSIEFSLGIGLHADRITQGKLCHLAKYHRTNWHAIRRFADTKLTDNLQT